MEVRSYPYSIRLMDDPVELDSGEMLADEASAEQHEPGMLAGCVESVQSSEDHKHECDLDEQISDEVLVSLDRIVEAQGVSADESHDDGLVDYRVDGGADDADAPDESLTLDVTSQIFGTTANRFVVYTGPKEGE